MFPSSTKTSTPDLPKLTHVTCGRMRPSSSSCAAEFLGTFFLVLTVGCNIFSGQEAWSGVSIALVLTVLIYALASASGANFNPAVSVALGLTGKLPASTVAGYCGIQLLAAVFAGFLIRVLSGGRYDLGPARDFRWKHAMICESVYTFMLCFVVLNVAASRKLGGKNQFYGLAIGFVIVAGAYGAGSVSGGCFNPAVALGTDLFSGYEGFGRWVSYTVFELLGGVAAVGAFYVVRPSELTPGDDAAEASITPKLAAEAIGTFMLVFTVGLNVLARSSAGAFSIAASLMCMVYSVGDISGGHFNPAVTLAILARKKIGLAEALKYISAQLLAAVLAGLLYSMVHQWSSFPLGPQRGFTWADVAVAEIVFTLVLCFVVLSVAVIPQVPTDMFGLAIGSCVTVGGIAVGKISGGSLNPAVSFAVAATHMLNGGTLLPAILYCSCEILGGTAAAGLVRIVFSDQPDITALKEAP